MSWSTASTCSRATISAKLGRGRGRRLHVAARLLPAGLLRRRSRPLPLPALQGRQPAHAVVLSGSRPPPQGKRGRSAPSQVACQISPPALDQRLAASAAVIRRTSASSRRLENSSLAMIWSADRPAATAARGRRHCAGRWLERLPVTMPPATVLLVSGSIRIERPTSGSARMGQDRRFVEGQVHLADGVRVGVSARSPECRSSAAAVPPAGPERAGSGCRSSASSACDRCPRAAGDDLRVEGQAHLQLAVDRDDHVAARHVHHSG